MKWFFTKFIFLLLINLELFSSSYAQEETNLEFITKLTDNILEEITKEFFDKLKNKIIIKSLDINTDVDWFFENQMYKALKSYNFESIYLANNSEHTIPTYLIDEEVSIIEFKILKLGIDYYNKNDENMNKVDYVVRKGHLSFFLRVIQKPTGEIIWHKNVAESKEDWIPLDKVKKLENPNVSFTRSMLNLNSGKRKIFEPLLITGVTGIIVYLFYSLRSR